MIHFAPEYLMNPTHPITVAVVGVGGNGTQALHDLAKIHMSLLALGHVGLDVQAIDDDVVEVPNIGRQKFSDSDLGRYKAEVIITRLNRFYGLDWKSIPERYEKKNKIDVNIIISCVDNVKTRRDVYEDFVKINSNVREYQEPYYWMDFGNAKDSGQFILGSNIINQPDSEHETASSLPSVIEMFPSMEESEEDSGPSCSTREALSKQNLFINSVLVSTGMNLIWELLTTYYITYRGGYVNLKTGTTKSIKV